ncbi:hypothetical protein BGZ81_003469 [Podila clonocystis]|nr:hypothetical protein BGZ81_003469 [Podila clonocystis]
MTKLASLKMHVHSQHASSLLTTKASNSVNNKAWRHNMNYNYNMTYSMHSGPLQIRGMKWNLIIVSQSGWWKGSEFSMYSYNKYSSKSGFYNAIKKHKSRQYNNYQKPFQHFS